LVQTLEARPYSTPLALRSGLVLVGEALDGDDRAEDLVLDDLVVLAEAGDDGGVVEVAAVAPRYDGPRAAGVDRGVVGQPVDHAGHPGELVGLVEGAEGDARVVGQPGAGRRPGRRAPARKSSWTAGA
jgi:hypothetical protein